MIYVAAREEKPFWRLYSMVTICGPERVQPPSVFQYLIETIEKVERIPKKLPLVTMTNEFSKHLPLYLL